MAVYKLKVLSAQEAKTKGVLALAAPGPIMTKEGPDDYVCGSCNRTIAKSVTLNDLTMLQNAAFQCFSCKKVNAL